METMFTYIRNTVPISNVNGSSKSKRNNSLYTNIVKDRENEK